MKKFIEDIKLTIGLCILFFGVFGAMFAYYFLIGY